MGINAYVYSVEDSELKERIDQVYLQKPHLDDVASLFGLQPIQGIRDLSGYRAQVVIGKDIRLNTESAGISGHSGSLNLDYVLALVVDGPAMSHRNGWRKPDQRQELEKELREIDIDTENLSYLGIFQGDTNLLVSKDKS